MQTRHRNVKREVPFQRDMSRPGTEGLRSLTVA
jgi:hypothetical protein